MAIDPTSESLVVGIKNFIKNMVRRQSPGAKGIFDLFWKNNFYLKKKFIETPYNVF